jgi:hypothetical protein
MMLPMAEQAPIKAVTKARFVAPATLAGAHLVSLALNS